jgi:hypothetical protein
MVGRGGDDDNDTHPSDSAMVTAADVPRVNSATTEASTDPQLRRRAAEVRIT